MTMAHPQRIAPGRAGASKKCASARAFAPLTDSPKALAFDNAGNVSIEVGKLDALPGIIDTLVEAVHAGELDAQLAAASSERRKNFKRRASKLPQA
jgi:hypothetical protein